MCIFVSFCGFNSPPLLHVSVFLCLSWRNFFFFLPGVAFRAKRPRDTQSPRKIMNIQTSRWRFASWLVDPFLKGAGLTECVFGCSYPDREARPAGTALTGVCANRAGPRNKTNATFSRGRGLWRVIFSREYFGPSSFLLQRLLHVLTLLKGNSFYSFCPLFSSLKHKSSGIWMQA